MKPGYFDDKDQLIEQTDFIVKETTQKIEEFKIITLNVLFEMEGKYGKNSLSINRNSLIYLFKTHQRRNK